MQLTKIGSVELETAATPPPAGAAPRIWDFVFILLRRRVLIGAVALGVFLVGLVAALLAPTKYTATAVLLLDPRAEQVVSETQALSKAEASSALMDSELQLMRSGTLARRLVQELDLTHDREFSSRSGRAGKAPDALVESVATAVLKAVTVQRSGMSYVINVSAESKDPAKAARIANAVADLYMRLGAESQIERAQRASTWLSGRLVELRTETQQKESAVQAFRVKSGLLSSRGETLTEQRITTVQGSVLEARADLAEKEARAAQVEAMMRARAQPDSIASLVNSDILRDLRQREADLTRRRAEYANRYGPLHPAVGQNKSELDDVRRQIANENARLSQSMRRDVEIARLRLQALEGSLVSATSDLTSNDASQVRLNELERDAAASRSVYESFLQRSREVSEQGSLGTNARVVARAHAPQEPSTPGLKLKLLAVIAVALAFGAGVGLMAEALDDNIADASAMEQKAGLFPLASIPTILPAELENLAPTMKNPAGYLLERPYSAFAEGFRVLHAAVAYAPIDPKASTKTSVIAVTSGLSGEGKTTSAVCLARLGALARQKVLLVDCDVRRRSLSELVEEELATGLIEVLRDGKPWRNALVSDHQTTVQFLPIAPADLDLKNEGLFNSKAMATLLTEVKSEFDLVILDCAPILAVAETRALVRLADGVVLIARAGHTPRRAIVAAAEQVRLAGGRLVGAALNQINPKEPTRYTTSDSLYFQKAGAYYQH